MGLGSLCPGVFNEPLGVDWKLLAGTGPRWKVVEKDQFRLYLAALYMFENEKKRNLLILCSFTE